MVDPQQLRVSDAEREHVVGLLQRAVGHGLLTLDEFSGRSDIALAARTRGELNAVLVDLPGLVHSEAAPPGQGSGMRPVGAGEPLVLSSTLSGLKRAGRWRVPREMVVRSRLGSTQLDFSEAIVDHDRVDVLLDVTAGSVELVVPAGAGVHSSDLVVAMGSLHDRRSDDGPGRPLFVLTGRVVAGSVEIRHPRLTRIGQFARRIADRMSGER